MRDNGPAGSLESCLQADRHHDVGVENVSEAEVATVSLAISPQCIMAEGKVRAPEENQRVPDGGGDPQPEQFDAKGVPLFTVQLGVI